MVPVLPVPSFSFSRGTAVTKKMDAELREQEDLIERLEAERRSAEDRTDLAMKVRPNRQPLSCPRGYGSIMDATIQTRETSYVPNFLRPCLNTQMCCARRPKPAYLLVPVPAQKASNSGVR